jgi:NADH-quinone oxidoreductase subunit I
MKIWGTGLLNGLRISMRNLRRCPITMQYPFEKYELPERARWTVVPLRDDEGTAVCTACGTCVKTCPDHVLALEVTTNEDRSKHIDHFSYQLGACMMCGLCVEACPFSAIAMSHDYELARTDPAALEYDLLTDVPAYKPKRDKPVAASVAPAADTADATTPPAVDGGDAS